MNLDSKLDYYLEKADRHPKLQTFMYFIPLPKHRTLFKFLTMCFFIFLEIFFKEMEVNTFFIPSVFCIFLLWKFQVAVNSRLIIAEDCMVEEYFLEMEDTEDLKANYPGDVTWITEEEKDLILECQVQSKLNSSLLADIKNHHVSLLITVVYYFLLYFAVTI